MNVDNFSSALAADEDERIAEIRAKAALRPSMQAAFTVARHCQSVGELSIGALVTELDQQVAAVHGGDLRQAEAMLLTQACTLNALFNSLAQKALAAPGLDMQDRVLRLALKAQTQSRATLETLAAIKNPQPVAFIKQANVAQNQQINNGPTSAGNQPRARKNKKRQNKLLERNDGERLDTRTSAAAGGADPEMAAVGEINRPQNTGRQGKSGKKR